MGSKSSIEWTDATWTPIRVRSADGEYFLDEKMLMAPLRWRKPRRVFVCSMTDLFGEWVPDEWIDRMFAVMALTPQHTYQVLTKRPERMREYMGSEDEERAAAIGEVMTEMTGKVFSGNDACSDEFEYMPWPLPNVWLGTELATLAAQAERYREALETAREALNWRDNEIRLGIRDPLGEEEIRAVGERFGYGVLMSTASRLWYEKAGSGAFAVGHCIAIVEKADRVAAAALEKEAHHD